MRTTTDINDMRVAQTSLIGKAHGMRGTLSRTMSGNGGCLSEETRVLKIVTDDWQENSFYSRVHIRHTVVNNNHHKGRDPRGEEEVTERDEQF
jgi:hypothetical protein